MLQPSYQSPNHTPVPGKSPCRVLLTGFRATGKSQTGRLLAQRMGYRFIDTDQEMVSRMGCSVAEFVQENGWSAFRLLEKELLDELCHEEEVVIATGGGAVQHEQQWSELRRHSLSVWLQADAETIRKRMTNDAGSPANRPPLGDGGSFGEIEEVLAQREPRYRRGSDLAIDTGEKSPSEIAEFIKQFIISG